MASTSSAEGARQNSSDKEKLITVLSIDGGGIRGIIPATILAFLEEELKVRCLYVHIYLSSISAIGFVYRFPRNTVTVVCEFMLCLRAETGWAGC
jgi:hypothetical protein